MTLSLMTRKVWTTSERENSSSGGPACANGMSVRVAALEKAWIARAWIAKEDRIRWPARSRSRSPSDGSGASPALFALALMARGRLAPGIQGIRVAVSAAATTGALSTRRPSEADHASLSTQRCMAVLAWAKRRYESRMLTIPTW